MWLNAPGWSRAHLLDTAGISTQVPIVVDEQGNIYLLILGVEGRLGPRILALDRGGRERWSSPLAAETNAGRRPRLVWTGQELIAFWIQRGELIAAVVTPAGELLVLPRAISGQVPVAAFAVDVSPAGQVSVWFSGSGDDPGIYALNDLLNARDPLPIDPDGIRPEISFDSGGDLYVTWTDEPAIQQKTTFVITRYRGGQPVEGEEIGRVRPALGTTDELDGPKLGLDGEFGYLFWTAIIRTGLRAGETDTMLSPFRLTGTAETAKLERLSVPARFDPLYENKVGFRLQAGDRVDVARAGERTYNVRALYPSSAGQGELAVAIRGRINTRSRQTQSQIGVLFLRQGSLQEYQLLSNASSASVSPYLTADRQGFLYATWLEITDVGEYTIYMAGTAPTLRNALGLLTRNDVRVMGTDTLFGLVSGMVLAPITLLWMLGPLVLLVLTGVLRRGETDFTQPRSLLSLWLAIGSYWGIKLTLFPALVHNTPFAAWIPVIPVGLALALRLGVPLLIALAGMLVAWRSLRAREVGSPAVFFVVYGLVDGVLTVAIYGVYMLGL